ncbi:unnamed protein product [Blepharisma stoltei]|uniref:Uncharacterized protein n=1 Tax=Blepharisma stoltei TaxID=1481888 RepID=A0AAU9JVY2_9CILI|nr:unnamed protein product [Blepharisma stoltei]
METEGSEKPEDQKIDPLLEIKDSISELKKSYNEIRGTVLDLLPILKDFRDLIQGKSLFEKGFFFLNSLAKEIKSNILTEINNKLSEPYDILRELRAEFDNFKDSNYDQHYEIKDSLDIFKSQLEVMFRNQAAMTEREDFFENKISDLKEDLALKAPFGLFNKLSDTVTTKASIGDIKDIEDKIIKLVSLQEFRALNDQVEWLNQKMNSYASRDMISNLEKTIIDNVMGQVGDYCKKTDFAEEVEKIQEKINLTKKEIDTNKETHFRIADKLKSEISKVNNSLHSKPWNPDIEFVISAINKKTDEKDFNDFKIETEPQIRNFDIKVNIFSKKTELFEKIIERYDELLLDKASKDDLSKIQQVLPTFCKENDFISFKINTESHFTTIDNRQIAHIDNIHYVNSRLDTFDFNFKIFKKDMKLFLNLYNHFEEFKQKIENKADKEDLYSMNDLLSKQEDMVAAAQAIDDLHKQLEMQAILHHATIKTLLDSTDTAGTKNRKRLEIYRNSSSLLNWISNSIAPEMDKLVGTARNLINSSFNKSMLPDHDSPDIILPLLPSHDKKRSKLVTPIPVPNT